MKQEITLAALALTQQQAVATAACCWRHSTPTGVLAHFGFASFRPGQRQVIEALCAGRSAVAIFPTGAGKSLCYQLPALLLDGLTLVISPLLALMKDQVDALVSRGIAAARLDSTLTAEDERRIQARLQAGEIKLLYIAPERLGNESFLGFLRSLKISLLAIDEAHCISEWGHNFRPDYLKLAALSKELRISRVLALTATATPGVARDVAATFSVAPSDVINTGAHRPNLALHITRCTHNERQALLQERLSSRPRGATIVYVTSQKTAEEVALLLASQGLPARPYHAGLGSELRQETQDWFMRGEAHIVVATIAFGMGIDKADIRQVYHYNTPKSLENYAQEIGRAGRDGAPSTCELFACQADIVPLENFIFGDTPTKAAVASVVTDILRRGEAFDLSLLELSATHDIRAIALETLLVHLELGGVLAGRGPFWSEVKFQPLRPLREVVAQFDARRAEFLRRIFLYASQARIWFTLSVDEAAQALREPRERIMSALGYLESRGELLLQRSGARYRYRRLASSVDCAALADELHERFYERERQDLKRLRRVLEFAAGAGCYTRQLLLYFGEELANDCRHCGWCQGERPRCIDAGAQSNKPLAEITASLGRLVESPALSEPRQKARYLCGISSPATVRARLTRAPEFGALSDVPFSQVLTQAENLAAPSKRERALSALKHEARA